MYSFKTYFFWEKKLISFFLFFLCRFTELYTYTYYTPSQKIGVSRAESLKFDGVAGVWCCRVDEGETLSH